MSPLPWAQIRSIRLDSVRLVSRSKITSSVSLTCAGKTRRYRIDLSRLPNGLFLPALLMHVAAQHQIPVTGRLR